MKTTVLSLLAVLVTLSCSPVGAADWKERLREMRGQTMDVSATKEEAYRAILEHEAKRVKHLEAKLEQHKERLEAHKHGRNLLSDEEHAKLSHQSTIYARHLKQLESETKEEKMEKVREANEMLQLNHLDRLTF